VLRFVVLIHIRILIAERRVLIVQKVMFICYTAALHTFSQIISLRFCQESVTLQLTVNPSVRPSILAPSPWGTYEQILAVVKTLAVLLSWGVFPDGSTGLSCNRSQSLSVLVTCKF